MSGNLRAVPCRTPAVSEGLQAADSHVPCSSPAPHLEWCLLGEVGTRLAWLCSSALAAPRRPLTKNHLQKQRAKGGRGELCSVTAGSSALLGLLSKKTSKCCGFFVWFLHPLTWDMVCFPASPAWVHLTASLFPQHCSSGSFSHLLLAAFVFLSYFLNLFFIF